MTDPEIRAVSRDLAALPHAERKVSLLIHRLENALRHAGLLGDPLRLRELGTALRAAGLTKDVKSDEDGPGGMLTAESYGFFDRCLDDAERAAEVAGWRLRVIAMRSEWENRQGPDRSWVHEIDWDLEVQHPGWFSWDPPPIGEVVVRLFNKHAPR